MYTPAYFAVDPESTAEFLGRIEVADLVTSTDHGLVATFLPLIFAPELGERERSSAMLREERPVEAHASRGGAGDRSRRRRLHQSELVATKAEHGRVVPTWDYTTAHVTGSCRSTMTSSGWTGSCAVSRHGTRGAGRSRGASTTLAAQFHAGQLRAIVGIELLITRVEAKFKMSQTGRKRTSTVSL